jgi:ketosteroid isomerase-like protein
VIDQLRVAAEALNQGDPEPFAALIADENEWRGVSRGHLWWKQTPSCHGADEALDVLRLQLKKPGLGSMQIRPTFTQIGDDRIIGSTEWVDENDRRIERFQVLTFRAGKIVDMQGCTSLRAAERFARS